MSRMPSFKPFPVTRRGAARALVPVLVLALAACRTTPPPDPPSTNVAKPVDAPAEPPASDVTWRALVLGDGGEPGPVREAADKAAKARIAAGGPAPVMLMPGDLFYPRGLPDLCAQARGRVVAEYTAKYAGITFAAVAGNHDHGDPHGEAHPATAHRAAYFDCAFHDELAAAVGWTGSAGCPCVPGWTYPSGGQLAGSAPLGPFTLVTYDSQAAIANAKPVAEALAKALEAAPRDRRIVVMAHHPFASYGPHGGNEIRSPQDLKSHEYRQYLDAVKPVIEANRERIALLVFGHDHVVQYFAAMQPPMLVAGAAAKTSPVAGVPADVFAAGDGPGLAELEAHADGSLDVLVLTAQEPHRFRIAAP